MQALRSSTGWNGGWWAGATRCESPNFGPRPPGERPRLVIVHSISLPPGHFKGRAVERLFTNRLNAGRHAYFEGLRGLHVSAHFFVRRDGEILQFVGCGERAWHAGVSSWRGRDNCNDWSLGIELEGLEGGSFTARQYRQLGRLMRELTAHCPIEEIVGHEHVAPGRKRDPGPGFEWNRLRRRLAGARVRAWPILAPGA